MCQDVETPMIDRRNPFSVNRSNPVRVWLEHHGLPVAYELSVRAPTSNTVRPEIDVRRQIEHDELPFVAIERALRRFVRTEPHVQCVAISHTGRDYSLAVLIDTLSMQLITELQLTLTRVLDCFRKNRPMVYLLGPDQRNSPLFTAIDCYVVERFNCSANSAFA